MTAADWQSVVEHYRAEIRRVKAEARASHFPDFRGAVQEVRKKMLVLQRMAAVEPPPDSPLRRKSDNDDCADATRIGDGDFTGYSWDASRDGFSSCVGGSLVDVWYRYTAPSSGRRVVMLSTENYYSDSALSVHQGGPCGDKTNEIACAFDCGLSIDDTSCVSFQAKAGEEYLFRIIGFDNPIGNYSLHVAQPGSISGWVVQADTGKPFDNLEVDIFESEGHTVAYGYPDASGYYTVNDLPAGTYYARTYVYEDYYIDQEFDRIPCPCSDYYHYYATPIIVTPGGNTSDISFSIAPGGDIAGRVTAGGSSVWYGEVRIWDKSGRYADSVDLNYNGSYRSHNLPPGAYHAMVNANVTGYLDEVYKDIPCSYCDHDIGSPIFVSAGSTTEGIDFNLDYAGKISGTVLSDDGLPISASIRIVDTTGEWVSGCDTNELGVYTCGSLVAGDYYVRTWDAGEYLGEFYDNVPCNDNNCPPTAGNTVPVQQGTTTAGIDFRLTKLGSITGYVRDAVTGAGLQSPVMLYRSGNYWNREWTDSSGHFELRYLTAGTYFVTADADNYVGELYDGIPCDPDCDWSTGTPIPVALGTETMVDFNLDRGGSISGTLTDALTGQVIPNATVEFYDSNFNLVSSTVTDETGRYTSYGFQTGLYYGRTWTSTHRNEIYPDVPCRRTISYCDTDQATPIAVTMNADTAGINFALNPFAHITGRVLAQSTHDPVRGKEVDIYTPDGQWYGYDYADSQGEYSVAVEPGTYFASTFEDEYYSDPPFKYLDEIYDGILCRGCPATAGTPIKVTDWATTRKANFYLRRSGAISGNVAGYPYSFVQIFNDWGERAGLATTDESGDYTVGGLIPGNYFAKTQNYAGVLDELYREISCPQSLCDPRQGTPIRVRLGATTPGINFALEPGGGIEGKVIDAATGYGIAHGRVEVRDASGFTLAEGYLDDYGNYFVQGLSQGQYYVVARPWDYMDHLGELYPDVPCPRGHCDVALGQAVPVHGKSITYGVDFTLEQGGSISGTITDASTGGAPGYGYVYVYDEHGNLLGDSYSGYSDAGYYIVHGLATGYYFIRASIYGFVGEVYNNVPCPFETCDPATGARVFVTKGAETPGIDFALDQGGLIQGLVTDALTEQPLRRSHVNLYDGAGALLTSIETNNKGSWYANGTPPGTVFVMAPAEQCHDAALYDNQPCAGAECDPTTGTPIPIVAGEATPEIDIRVNPAASLFCDDFEDSLLDSHWTYSGGYWMESSGALVGKPAVRKTTATASPVFAGCEVCSFTTGITPSSGNNGLITVFAWYSDRNNTIELLVKQETGKWTLRQRSAGRVVANEDAVRALELNRTYQVKLTFDGARFLLYVDDFHVPLITLDSPATVRPGTVGFQVKDMKAAFDSIRIY